MREDKKDVVLGWSPVVGKIYASGKTDGAWGISEPIAGVTTSAPPPPPPTGKVESKKKDKDKTVTDTTDTDTTIEGDIESE
jgi:hypothetical protein